MILVRSDFGPRTHPVTGAAQMHTGIDIGRAGDPVWACRAGRVSRVDRVALSPNWRNGNAVFVRDIAGYTWAYLHLARVAVTMGDQVRAGQLLGTVGNTGRTTALAPLSSPAPASWGPPPDGRAWPTITQPDGSVWHYNARKGFHLHLQVTGPDGQVVDPKRFFPGGTFDV